MAYGLDSALLMILMDDASRTGELDVSGMDLYALPPLPEGLRTLDVSDTGISVLPPLPSTLRHLKACETAIRQLPALPEGLEALLLYDSPIQDLPYHFPSTLRILDCSATWIIEIHSLPDRLELLQCSETILTRLPWLPESLSILICRDTQLPIRVGPEESMESFIQRWRDEECRGRMQSKMRVLKEGIIREALHPRRVSRILELGGVDVFDIWMGC